MISIGAWRARKLSTPSVSHTRVPTQASCALLGADVLHDAPFESGVAVVLKHHFDGDGTLRELVDAVDEPLNRRQAAEIAVAVQELERDGRRAPGLVGRPPGGRNRRGQHTDREAAANALPSRVVVFMVDLLFDRVGFRSSSDLARCASLRSPDFGLGLAPNFDRAPDRQDCTMTHEDQPR